jgi:hypothetical protein
MSGGRGGGRGRLEIYHLFPHCTATKALSSSTGFFLTCLVTHARFAGHAAHVAEQGGGYFPSEPVSTGSIGILCRPCRAETGEGQLDGWGGGGRVLHQQSSLEGYTVHCTGTLFFIKKRQGAANLTACVYLTVGGKEKGGSSEI